MKSFRIPERGTDVMVLQNCSVVVEQSSFRARHYVKVICGPRVFEVMYQGRDEGCEYFQIGHPIL